MTNGLPPLEPLCCPPGGEGDVLPLLFAVGALCVAHGGIQWFRNRKGNIQMKHRKTGLIVGILLLAIAAVLALKQHPASPADSAPPTELATTTAAAPAVAPLPRLLELGAYKCVPCKMMAPILDELRTELNGQLQVDFIDVWKDENAGAQFGVRVIPLQIFFDAAGKELFRHDGFFAKEDILAKWKELGFEFK